MEDKKKKITLIIIIAVLLILAGLFFFKTNEKKFTVTFENANLSAVTIADGDKLKQPDNPTKTGYKFVGWVQEDGVTPFDFNTPITKDTKIVAQWEPELTDDIYEITFDSNGGSKVEMQKINGNGKVVRPENPTKKGYEFVEWQLDGSPYNFENTLVNQNMTLKAVWKEEGKLTVTFDSDGGSTVKSASVKKGGTVKQPTNPTKSGYKFVRWTLDGAAYDFSTKVENDITLVAEWKEKEQEKEVEKFTVTFNNEGTKYKTVSVEKNKTVTAPTAPTKTNMIFKEWQLDGVKFDFSTKITKDITLEAVFREPKTLTVTFDLNDGTGNKNEVSVTEGKKVSTPTKPTRSGYTFKEWQLNGSKYDFSKKVTKNITLKAKWTKNTVTKTYTYTVCNQSGTSASSPQKLVTLYENGTSVSFKILVNGNLQQSKTVPDTKSETLNESLVNQITGFRLTDGSTVTAKKVDCK